MLLRSPLPNTITHVLLYFLALIISTHPQTLVYANDFGIYSSAFDDGQALYVLHAPIPNETLPDSTERTSKAYVIDLTVNWNTSNPVTTQLPDGPVGPLLTSTLLPNGRGWLVVSNNTPFLFNPSTKNWTMEAGYNGIESLLYVGVSAMADPSTGIVYIPNASYYTIAESYMMTITVVDWSTNPSYGSIPMSRPIAGILNYALAWSKATDSLIMYGGITTLVYAYSVAKGWSTLSFTGDVPPARTDACLVAAYNGTKVILFGGFDTNLLALNDIYIMDLVAMTCTKGPAIEPKNGRGGAACAASNDFFIATGGFSYSKILNTTIVYNVKTANWTSAYNPIPPSPPLPPVPVPLSSLSSSSSSSSPSTTLSLSTSTLSASISTTPAPTSSTSGGGSRVVTILGAFTGISAAIFVTIGAVMYRKRTMKSNIPIDFNNTPPISANYYPPDSDNYPLNPMDSRGRLSDPPHSPPQSSYYSNEPFSPPQPSYHSNDPFSPPQPSYYPNENFSFQSYNPPYPPPAPVVMNAYWATPPTPEIKTPRNPAAIVTKEFVYPRRKYSVSSAGMENMTGLGGSRKTGAGSTRGDRKMENPVTKKNLGGVQDGCYGSRWSSHNPHTLTETRMDESEEEQDEILEAYQDHYYAKPYSRGPHTRPQTFNEPHKPL